MTDATLRRVLVREVSCGLFLVLSSELLTERTFNFSTAISTAGNRKFRTRREAERGEWIAVRFRFQFPPMRRRRRRRPLEIRSQSARPPGGIPQATLGSSFAHLRVDFSWPDVMGNLSGAATPANGQAKSRRAAITHPLGLNSKGCPNHKWHPHNFGFF